MVLKEKKILVIDDTPSIRTFLRISLEAQGVRFSEAATAGEGVTLCGQIAPDFVVLDLGLPDRDGLSILPELIAHEKSRPQVIILSVRKEAETKQRAMELGASAYITKPFLMEDLIEAIQGNAAVH
jgi:DNA-binding response OmpR family regulator